MKNSVKIFGKIINEGNSVEGSATHTEWRVIHANPNHLYPIIRVFKTRQEAEQFAVAYENGEEV